MHTHVSESERHPPIPPQEPWIDGDCWSVAHNLWKTTEFPPQRITDLRVYEVELHSQMNRPIMWKWLHSLRAHTVTHHQGHVHPIPTRPLSVPHHSSIIPPPSPWQRIMPQRWGHPSSTNTQALPHAKPPHKSLSAGGFRRFSLLPWNKQWSIH